MTRSITLSRPVSGPRRTGLVARVLSLVALRRQRRKLAELGDAMLRDIGLTRAEALEEATRPAWDSPAYWRQ